MKKRKGLFFALCLIVTSLCLFFACDVGGTETEENSSPSTEGVLPDDPPNEETPGEESSTNSGIQFPEVPLP